MVASLNAANNYSNFDGNSKAGEEGRWIGFKHSGHGMALVLYGYHIYGSTVYNSGTVATWKIL